MTEPIRGLDEPVSVSKPSKWWWLVGAFFLLGSVLWIYDAVVETDEEAAAKTLISFYEDLRDKDGEAVCAALTPATRSGMVGALGKNGPNCAEAAALIGEQLPADLTSGISDWEEDEIAEHLEVKGSRILLSDGSKAFTGFWLTEIDGEWLIEIPALRRAEPSGPGGGKA